MVVASAGNCVVWWWEDGRSSARRLLNRNWGHRLRMRVGNGRLGGLRTTKKILNRHCDETESDWLGAVWENAREGWGHHQDWVTGFTQGTAFRGLLWIASQLPMCLQMEQRVIESASSHRPEILNWTGKGTETGGGACGWRSEDVGPRTCNVLGWDDCEMAKVKRENCLGWCIWFTRLFSMTLGCFYGGAVICTGIILPVFPSFS